jgi:predicted transcriptional regulator
MTIELRLVRDGKTIFSFPINSSSDEADRGKLELEEDDMERLADLYSIAASERRFRIMHELARRGQMKHSDILRIAMNPKFVQDCINPMVEGGIVIHEGRHTGYRPSSKGFAYVTLTTGLSRILELLEEEMEADE